MNVGSDGDMEGDELDDLPSSRGNQWKGPISRKPSQTSVYLQEWDIPFEQLDLGELIGKVRCLKFILLVHELHSEKTLLLNQFLWSCRVAGAKCTRVGGMARWPSDF